jgi:K+-sensing histidine kinase KdpD
MVCVDASPLGQNLIRRGWRMANRCRTELLAVARALIQVAHEKKRR